MDETSRDLQSNANGGKRSRSSRTVTRVALLLVVVGISAAVFWATYGQFGTLYGQFSAFSRSATAQPQADGSSQPGMEASDNSPPSLSTLQQSIQELQASQQRTAEQLELVQRQLASEQGERKLLSEQVGALSGRLDGRSAMAAAVTTGNALPIPKRKPAMPAGGTAIPPVRTGAIKPPT
jgi:uncharacterized protein HemX